MSHLFNQNAFEDIDENFKRDIIETLKEMENNHEFLTDNFTLENVTVIIDGGFMDYNDFPSIKTIFEFLPTSDVEVDIKEIEEIWKSYWYLGIYDEVQVSFKNNLLTIEYQES